MRYLSDIPKDIADKARQEALKDYERILSDDLDFLVLPEDEDDADLWSQGTPEDE